MNKLAKQAEQILDEATQERVDVIVQFDLGESGAQLLEVASEAMKAVSEQRLSVTARDLRPLPRAEIQRSERSVRAARGIRSLSVASKVAVAYGDEAQASKERLQVRVQEAADQSRGLQALKQDLDAGEHVFALAGSVGVRTSRDALWKVANDPDASAGILGVFANRRLKVPAVVEPKSLPQNVLDNKISAWGVAATGAMAVWGAMGARGAGVKVAVLDTGIDANHPDLAGKISDFAEFDPQGNEVPGAPRRDTDRHGTHVSGTIAGGNASGQWIGMAPEARLMGGIVLPGGTGSDKQILAGIDWAVNHGADVINMSLGGLILGPDTPPLYSTALVNAILLGIPVVTSIGNDGEQTSGVPGNDFFAFAVGATDVSDLPAGFSGGGTRVMTQSPVIDPQFLPLIYSKPDISAPGIAVRSSVPDGGYADFNGTSMAAPHVAGAVALLLSAVPELRNFPDSQRAFLLQDLLTSSVEELGEAGQDHRYGFGRLDVLRAVGFALEAV